MHSRQILWKFGAWITNNIPLLHLNIDTVQIEIYANLAIFIKEIIN